MTEQELALLRKSIERARQARAHGNHPFGALLADPQGHVILEAENTVVTGRDCTGHAETNLMREASRLFPRELLETCTLYASTEPCPMCAGAIFWGGVRRVVFALSEESLYAVAGNGPENLPLGCAALLAHGGHPTEVIGPLIEAEARTVHDGFWTASS